MRVLVTGGTGKLAKAMQAEPIGQTEYVYLSARGKPDAVTWDMATGDIDINGPFDAVFHLAAATPSGDQDFEGTAELTHAALRLAQRQSVPYFIAASSQAIYGAGKGKLVSENDPINPQNPYGVSKQVMEDILTKTAADYGVDRCTILRLGNVAGYDQLGQVALDPMRTTAIELTQLKDGSYPQRSYADIPMLNWLVSKLVKTQSPPILNVAAADPMGLDTFLDVIGAEWMPVSAGPNVIKTLAMDCTRLELFSEGRFDVSLPAMTSRLASQFASQEFS